jgi:hypothetical protein
MSGNTFGATFFLDGRRIAPMLPDIPNLTKCKKCDAIFWLSDLQEIGKCRGVPEQKEWEKANKVEHLKLNDLWRALQSLSEYCKNLDVMKEDDDGEFTPREREIFIRRRIWWEYNVKTKKTAREKVLCQQNSIELLNLLNTDIPDERCMAAELNRNLGNFSECLELIQNLPEKRYAKFKNRLTEECEKKNILTVEL